MANHKRRANKARKEFRAACWQHGKDRKAERRDEAAAAHRRNVESGTTPWLQAKAARAARRAGKQAAA